MQANHGAASIAYWLEIDWPLNMPYDWLVPSKPISSGTIIIVRVVSNIVYKVGYSWTLSSIAFR